MYTGEVYPLSDLAALPTSGAPMSALPVDSRCTMGVLSPRRNSRDRRTRRKEGGMIPEYLTATEAQRLLDLGRARLHGPERLTTARAVYQWDAATACYVREPEVPCSPPATPAPPIWSAVGAAAVPRTPRPAIGQPRLGLSRLASLTIRWQYWVGATRLFMHHPWFGVGWANFGDSYLAFRLPLAVEYPKDP